MDEQLEALGLPVKLRPLLSVKLKSVSGSLAKAPFAVINKPRRCLISNATIVAESDVWLVQHIWSFCTPADAKADLESCPELVQRMAAMLPADTNSDIGNAESGRSGASKSPAAGGPEREVAGGLERAAVAGVDRVLSALWRLAKVYSVGENDAMWYVEEEKGCAVGHSDSPNVRMCPFIYVAEDSRTVMACSLLWPIRDIAPGEVITRDYVPLGNGGSNSDGDSSSSCCNTAGSGGGGNGGSSSSGSAGSGGHSKVAGSGNGGDSSGDGRTGRGNDDIDEAALLLRQARLCAFLPAPTWLKEHAAEEYMGKQNNLARWAVEWRERQRQRGDAGAFEVGGPVGHGTAAAAADGSSCGDGGGSGGGLDGGDASGSFRGGDSGSSNGGGSSGSRLKVYSEFLYVAAELKRPEFEIVENAAEADIIWAARSVTPAFEAAAGGLKPGRFVNSYPYEGSLVLKHHLATTMAREFGDDGPGLLVPRTYTLPAELLAFMGDYWRREEENNPDTPNLWILKPWGLARGMGTVVCCSLAQAIRQLDLGPRIAQEYVASPLLFRGRKVDLRVVALLRSARPMELFVYDRFWPRVAARPYACSGPDAFADPEVSLTANHLLEGREEHRHVDCAEFAAEVEAMHPGVVWEDIMQRIRGLLRETFAAAVRQHPGMAADPRGRAIYGCDVMLTRELEPRLLEVTFCPGNLATSAAYPVAYPDYVNDVFGCLFLGEEKNVTRI